MATISDDFSTNLISHWEFEETSGTRYDSTANNNDLTDNNTVGYATGIQGNGADFEKDNNEYLSLANASQTDLAITSDLTFSAWVKLETVTPNGGFYKIISRDGLVTNRNYYFGIEDNSAGGYNLGITLGLFTTSGNRYIRKDYSFSADTWYHIVATWDQSAGECAFYVNGSAIDGGTFTTDDYSVSVPTAALNSVSTDFSIGGLLYNGTVYDEFDGIIDEVSIWNTVLSSSDVSTIYNSGDGIPYEATATSSIVKISGIAQASVAKVDGITEANIEKVSGISNTS